MINTQKAIHVYSKKVASVLIAAGYIYDESNTTKLMFNITFDKLQDILQDYKNSRARLVLNTNVFTDDEYELKLRLIYNSL